MKITSYDENWVFDEKVGAANVIRNKERMITKPLNISCVQCKAINTEWEYIMIPYDDEELHTAINGLAYDIAENNDWLYPDKENIKTSFMVHMDGKDCNTFKANLCIEVQPPVYSEEEKADILASADRNMYHTDFSEYTIWLDTFASAEAFHNGSAGGIDETVGIYNIEFELEEQNSLQWLLVQHLHMVACGGRYAS